MLYAHGSDLCHELELRHAMANCFEALMGALLLDGGIIVADKVFAEALFMESKELKDVSQFHLNVKLWNQISNEISFPNRLGQIIHHIHYKNKNHWAIENGLNHIRFYPI